MSIPCITLLSIAARSFTSPGVASGLLRSRVLCTCSTARKITSKRQMDHLERTASNFRQTALFPARVCGISNESETVKRLRLAVHPDFTFRAGQWVDFFIPGIEKVGGFSICSSPGLLQREGVIELAIKYTNHPPAQWVHTTCTVGSHIAMRVGGDFFFDPLPSEPPVDLLLVAGGVGINPLYSILLHVADLLRLNHATAGRSYSIGSTHLCYSSKNTQELLFKKTIIDVCREFPGKFSCDFHITQQTADIDQDIRHHVKSGRISDEELRAHVDPQKTLCYLCGPPPMTESFARSLVDMGLSEDRILFEKWW